jgi:hypothetical protein
MISPEQWDKWAEDDRALEASVKAQDQHTLKVIGKIVHLDDLSDMYSEEIVRRRTEVHDFVTQFPPRTEQVEL